MAGPFFEPRPRRPPLHDLWGGLSTNVVPIPGSKNKERIIENLDSANVNLTDGEFAALEDALSGLKVYGHRGLGGF